MAMRAPSSPICGVMHMAPTSAVSRAPRTAGGAVVMGRGPNSSRTRPVYWAPPSSMAAAILAATARLASSAISATCSPGRTPRHVSTAFRAPGIRSVCGEPKFILIILLELVGFSISGRLLRLLFPNWPIGRANAPCAELSRLAGRQASRGNAKRRDLSATAGYIGEAGGAEAREKTAEFSAEQVGSEIHQHVAVIHLADIRDVRKNFAPDRDALLNDPRTV